MRAILIKNDLWSYMDSKPRSRRKRRSEVTTQRRKICGIMLAISLSELNQIKEGDMREVWLKLHSTCRSKGSARKATLLKKIALSRMKEGDKVREHINEFFNTVSKLKEIEIEIGDLLADLAVVQLTRFVREISMETRVGNTR